MYSKSKSLINLRNINIVSKFGIKLRLQKIKLITQSIIKYKPS